MDPELPIVYSEPAPLATRIAASPRPVLVGLDIDGVLSPLVDHADDARLLDGVADALARFRDIDDVILAAVSGRALASMLIFDLPDHVVLVGSHGMEEQRRPMRPLTPTEVARLATLTDLANAAARDAGDGAWVESKKASVVLHVRTADVEAGRAALTLLDHRATAVPGATIKHGSNVVELFARHASKGTALRQLRGDTAAQTVVFVGDDITDEEAFAALVDGDVTIKVGAAPTIAAERLRDPSDVRELLTALATELNAP